MPGSNLEIVFFVHGRMFGGFDIAAQSRMCMVGRVPALTYATFIIVYFEILWPGH